MNSPLTFTTEAERLRAREQYVRICHAADIANESMRIGDWYYESLFDRTFPPIAPPKMVPPTDLEEAAWGIISNVRDWSKESLEWQMAVARWRDQYHERIARVRVVEVDDA